MEAAGSRHPAQLELSVEDALGADQYEGADSINDIECPLAVEGDQISARTEHAAAQGVC